MKQAVVIGLGIGMAHVAGYLESKKAKLYGVCDLIPQRLNNCGGTFEMNTMLCLKPLFSEDQLGKTWQELGVKTFTSFEDVLKDPNVDIVSICTPDYLHPNHLLRAVNSGKDILLEKPVGIDIQEADNITNQIINYSGTVGIGYEFRLNPAILKIKEIINSGEAGEVEAFSLYHFRTPFRRDKWNSWIQKKEFSGGLVIEETCHWFDLARYLTNLEVDSLYCLTNSNIHDDFDFEDIAYVNGKYKNGSIFQISHILTGFDFSLQLCLHGRKKTIWCALKEEDYSSLDGGETKYHAIVSCGKPGDNPGNAKTWKWGVDATEPFNIKELSKDFVDRLISGRPPLSSWNDGLESLRLSVKSLESAKSGKIVIV